ncbi:MAG: serine hydrolase domain-containing protein [Myxococcota bacterium]
MDSPIDIFARGVKEGVYPGGQIAASRECTRIVTAAAGSIGPGQGSTGNDVLYDLASLTKPLGTTILLGKAMEAGLCALEDPLGRFIPGVDPRVTLEQVLDHSAGYPAHQRFDLELPSELSPGSWDAWRHIVRAASQTPLIREPGTEAEYSDIGFILLGAALEVMHQRPLSVAQLVHVGASLFFRDRRGPPALPIIAPPHPIAPTEAGKTGVVHDENAEAMGGSAGHAGLFGTADAVLRLSEQLVLAYHGYEGGVLKPATVRRLWQPSRVKGSTRALGWDRPSKEGSSTGGRWPRSSIGHLGFTGTSVWIEPDRALVVVLVTNRVCPSRANNLIRRLRPLFYDAAWQHWAKAKHKPATEKRASPRRAAQISRPPIE